MGDLCLFMQSQLSLTCCLAKHPCQEINEPGKTSIQILRAVKVKEPSLAVLFPPISLI